MVEVQTRRMAEKMRQNRFSRKHLLISLSFILAVVGWASLPKGSSAQARNGFSYTGGMNTARAGHTATLLGDGRVMIAGFRSSQGELYDPSTGTFSPTGDMITLRRGHTATLLLDGRVLIAGGSLYSEVLSSAEVFDPLTGTFSPTGGMTTARDHHTATLLLDGKVLIAGGDGPRYQDLSSSELYDPSTDTFIPTGSMTTARKFHTATVLRDGKVLVAGGEARDGPYSVVLSSAELYIPSRGSFIPSGKMKKERSYHTATRLPSREVLILGGSGYVSFLEGVVIGGLGGSGSHAVLSGVELYDPARGNFKETKSMRTGHERHTATLLPNGKILIVGGMGTSKDVLSKPELYDPVHGTSTLIGIAELHRDGHTATLLNDGRVLIVGGSNLDWSGPVSGAMLYDWRISVPRR